MHHIETSKKDHPKCLIALDFKLLCEKMGKETAIRVMLRGIARHKEAQMSKITN